MKNRYAWIVYFALGTSWLAGAALRKGETVTERGPHHRVTERVTRHAQPDGTVLEEKARQVTLAGGLHYWDGQGWAESRELIEPHPNGAVAHYGPIKAAWNANLNTWGAVQLVDSDGRQLTGHFLGIALTDSESGKSVMIAQVKDCVGQIAAPNQIIFNDALTDIRARVTYTFSREGIHQDISILEMGPALDPATYGMNPATCRLEAYTEWIIAPAAQVTTHILKSEVDPQKRQLMAAPDIFDQDVNFGAVAFSKGRAIDFRGNVPDDIPVARTWETREQRQFLVETIDFLSVIPALNALPRQQAQIDKDARMAKVVAPAVGEKLARAFPAPLKQRAAVERQPMKLMARADVPGSTGLLWDWVLTLTGGLTNFTFHPGATYSVGANSTVNLYGNTTIMGGTIVKAAAGSVLSLNGSVVCDTTRYHPAVFAASTYNDMGDTVAGGSPSGYYATAALRASGTVTGELHDLRFLHAATAIDWTGSQDRFYNLQFINCSNAIRRVDATNAPVHNLLITNALYAFTGSNSTFNVQHLTANKVGTLINLVGTPATLKLTNSILFNVTNAGTGTIQLDYVATNGTASLPNPANGFTVTSADFASCAGGAHYLAIGSALHNAGSSIDWQLYEELFHLTTYAPTLLTGTAQVSLVLAPVVPRDVGTPDLGYHYSPLDYILRGYRLNTNVVLTMTNGVAVGVDYNGQSWGLIFDTATNISVGWPTNMNRFVRAHTVQERSTGNPGTRAMLYDIGNSGTHGNSESRWRFTEFATMAQDGYALYTGKYWKNFEWSHCWLYNLSITFSANNGGQKIGVTNNIFEWADANLQRGGSSSTFHLQNNLFRNYVMDVTSLNSTSTIHDTLFDRATLYTNGTTVTHSHNAYHLTTNTVSGTNVYSTNALPGLNNNIGLTSLTYDTDPYGRYGPYGRYYQPTNSPLIDAGSTTAELVGLYHFTTTTNQVKDGNGVLDIGPHYVALNQYGIVVDSDGDGVPDYYEDRNGNGSYDAGSGESDWQTYNSPNGLLSSPSLKVFTPLK